MESPSTFRAKSENDTLNHLSILQYLNIFNFVNTSRGRCVLVQEPTNGSESEVDAITVRVDLLHLEEKMLRVHPPITLGVGNKQCLKNSDIVAEKGLNKNMSDQVLLNLNWQYMPHPKCPARKMLPRPQNGVAEALDRYYNRQTVCSFNTKMNTFLKKV